MKIDIGENRSNAIPMINCINMTCVSVATLHVTLILKGRESYFHLIIILHVFCMINVLKWNQFSSRKFIIVTNNNNKTCIFETKWNYVYIFLLFSEARLADSLSLFGRIYFFFSRLTLTCIQKRALLYICELNIREKKLTKLQIMQIVQVSLIFFMWLIHHFNI